MNYLIYKITNTVNNKIYIGCHKTDDINDSYMGSGKILNRAIEKYGIDNFTKEVLHNFNNSEDMFYMESELVNEEFVKDKSTYNIKEGGFGGWDYVNNTKKNLYFNNSGECLNANINNLAIGRETQRWLRDNDPVWCAAVVNTISNGLKHYYNTGGIGAFKNKKHTEVTKRQIGTANSIKQKGSGNSQYGTMWITNDKESKKIKKDQPIPEGFRKGRKMNKRI